RLAPGESPRLVTLRDPEVGDELTAWPLQQANGGQPRQRLVDVDLLATARGLAWRVRRDGVGTRVGADAVEFVAPGGLILSEQARIEAPQSDDAVAPLQDPGDTSAPPPDRARRGPPQPDHAPSEPPPPPRRDGEAVVEPLPGVIGLVGGFEETRGGGSVQPREGGAPTAADEHRLERARGYLSRAMAAEALGVLGTFERSGDAATGRAQQALRGAAELIMGRIDEADTILGASEFDHDPEVALWRMAIAAAREDGPEALRQLQRSDRVLAAYPRPLRLRLGLAAARAAIETHETEFADTLLEQLNAAEPTPAERARLTFLEGLAEARKGAIATADRIWQALEQTGPADVRADAAFARTELLLDAGRLNPVAANARLAPTRALWRGHPREAAMLAALAEMYDDA